MQYRTTARSVKLKAYKINLYISQPDAETEPAESRVLDLDDKVITQTVQISTSELV